MPSLQSSFLTIEKWPRWLDHKRELGFEAVTVHAQSYRQYYRYCPEHYLRPLKVSLDCFKQGGGHYIGYCTPTYEVVKAKF